MAIRTVVYNFERVYMFMKSNMGLLQPRGRSYLTTPSLIWAKPGLR